MRVLRSNGWSLAAISGWSRGIAAAEDKQDDEQIIGEEGNADAAGLGENRWEAAVDK
jgi:hypothetical protein